MDRYGAHSRRRLCRQLWKINNALLIRPLFFKCNFTTSAADNNFRQLKWEEFFNFATIKRKWHLLPPRLIISALYNWVGTPIITTAPFDLVLYTRLSSY